MIKINNQFFFIVKKDSLYSDVILYQFVNPINFHLYHYAGNNPVKYTDPDGKIQTSQQKRITEIFSWLSSQFNSKKNPIMDNTTIEIYRTIMDNGNNGMYYQSTASVKVYGQTLDTVTVQSTPDHPKLNNGEKKYKGTRLKANEYTGIFLNKSGSYLNAIVIIGNEITEQDSVLIHPDVFTAKGETSSYSKIGKPYSLACQIMTLDNFNEFIDILNKLGFESGKTQDPEASWVKGDRITIKIYEPIPEYN